MNDIKCQCGNKNCNHSIRIIDDEIWIKSEKIECGELLIYSNKRMLFKIICQCIVALLKNKM